MTRGEYRAQCIEAMARAAYHVMTLRMIYRHGANLNLDLFDAQPYALKEDWIASQTAAFDSSWADARRSRRATEEMVEGARQFARRVSCWITKEYGALAPPQHLTNPRRSRDLTAQTATGITALRPRELAIAG
jgi:hypothetical protein